MCKCFCTSLLDSPEDMDIDEEQSNVLLYSQKSVSKESRSLSTSKRQRSESESSRKRKCLTKSKNPSQGICLFYNVQFWNYMCAQVILAKINDCKTADFTAC